MKKKMNLFIKLIVKLMFVKLIVCSLKCYSFFINTLAFAVAFGHNFCQVEYVLQNQDIS